MGTDGVLSRSVRDTAAAMDAIYGRETGAPYDSTPPTGSFLSAVAEARRAPLRIAVWTSAWDGIPLAPECVDAVQYAARLCKDLGHEIIETAPPALNYQQFFQAHRSAERRVGKECVSTCRSRWSPYH